MADITGFATGGTGPRRAYLAALAVIVLGLALGGIAAGLVAVNTAPAVATPVAATPAPTIDATRPSGLLPSGAPTDLPSASPSPASAATAITVAATVTPTPASSGRFSLVLLGYGGGGHDGSLLTDAMMVVIGDTERKTIALLSLPRDIWAPLDFPGSPTTYAKLNTAFAQATYSRPTPTPTSLWSIAPTQDHFPGQLARQTTEQILGIKLNYYVALDFQGFREAVDAIGGIDVVVPNGFTAQYPRNDDPSIDSGWKIVSFAAGPERMGGDRALVYTRARLTLDNSGEGSDFARASRQRIVLNAFKDRLLSATGLTRLPTLLTIASEHTRTDYPVPAAADLAKLLVSARDVRIYQATLGLDNYLDEATGPQGAYILVPGATGGSWAQVRAFARRFVADPATAEAIAAHRLTIVDRGGTYGLGSRVASRLTALGYPVGAVTVGTERDSTSLLVRGGSDSAATALAEALSRDLDLPEIHSAAEPARAYLSDDAVLELGADAALASTDLPSTDTDSPTSAYGVVRFGQWVAPAVETAVNVTPEVTAGAGTPRGTLTPVVAVVTGTAHPATTTGPVATATQRPAAPQLPTAPTATPVPRAAPTQPPAATKAPPTAPPATTAPKPTSPIVIPTSRPVSTPIPTTRR